MDTRLNRQSTIYNPQCMSSKVRWVATLALLFIGRLAFGLSSEFFSEDESQIFLMGLRYYATREWPYFGPDVVWTQSEIPGALQPLLIGIPLALVPVPESPFVLLNVLSFGALGLLAWYISTRLPALPRWLIWGWILTAPWTLQFSTHINNPSYVLPAAVVFFLGFLEASPSLSTGRLSLRAASFMMGAALTAMIQLHMSWPILAPYVALAWLDRVRHADRPIRALAAMAAWFALGAALPATLIIPTLLEYGPGGGSRNFELHVVPPDRLVTTLARFFSFASLEVNRFVAINDAKRFAFVEQYPWIVALALGPWLAGLAQPVWMLASWFRRQPAVPEWQALRRLIAFTVGLVYFSYWFVTEEPQAHAFYVVAPLAFVFVAYCWRLVDGPRWRTAAAVLMALNIAFHVALAWTQGPLQSLYRHRDVVAAAIDRREPEIFGHRRPFAIDAGPAALADPSRPYRVQDLVIQRNDLRIGFRRAASWSVEISNTNAKVAFRDLVYVAEYYDSSGRRTQQHQDVIKDLIQPGETRLFEVADMVVNADVRSGTIALVSAEALLPASPREKGGG
jgi:hypothetical protein